nr:nuclear transport factor 2 family protein [Ornithinimicrobium sp. HY1745]
MDDTQLRRATDAFYADVDTDDPAVFPRHLQPNATFRFNSEEPVPGVDNIRQAVEVWKGNFASVRHEIRDVTVDQGKAQVGVELVVTYTALNDEATVVKGASFVTFNDDLIKDWRVYVDTSGLG